MHIQFILPVFAALGDSFWDQNPWIPDFVALILGFAIIVVLFYWFRGGGSVTGFVISVDEEDITFAGEFPHHMEQMVIDFLREDCQIPGSYKIRGRWDEKVLAVVVQGEQARGMEQRIRNFLKLNLTAPGGK